MALHRKDADGNLRDLHVDKALDVSTLTPLNTDFEAAGELKKHKNHTTQLLASCEYFTTSKVDVNGLFTHDVSEESFEAVIVIEGSISIEADDKVLKLEKGESAFIDAGSQNIKIDGQGSYLSVSV